MTDLSLISFDDLLAELYKRYDACVVITRRLLSKDDEDVACHYHGGKATAIGLCETLKRGLLDDLCEPGEEEGEAV